MTDNEFKALLNKYQKGTTSEKESLVIERYLEKFQNEGLQEADVTYNLAIKNNIYSKISKKKEKFRVFNFRTVAAAMVLLLVSSSIIYYFNKNSDYIEVIAHKGEQSKVLLSDSSVVYLNSGSSLKYPKTFKSDSREVMLEGEGFFIVKSNPKKPFIVTSAAFKTQVLGTQFVVSNYNRITPSVTVSSGKVQVTNIKDPEQSVLLVKNERVQWSEETNKFLKTHVQATRYTAWVDGSIVFNTSNLIEVVNILNQRFDKDIIITSDVYLDCTISGTYKNKSLADILESLHFIYDIKYKHINNKTIEITAKPCKN
ncbi:FecR family protein [Formosa algae]|uniref:FecR family protein n=1 Tax=Formosa algae TaxID=225843 RepID=UPI000CCE246F|nr:FecR domain-containing protein [Formosa algae]PNW25745.1 hypothetical protein BKP44_19195 [Formosa algae]